MKVRTPIYVSTPVNPTVEQTTAALQLSAVLFSEGHLPILPCMYQQFFQPTYRAYADLCEQLFKQCTEAFSIGEPDDDQAAMFKRGGVTPRVV